MNSEKFIICIRQLEDSPEVVELLQSIGFTKKLKMPKDDIDARVDLPKKGLSLIFRPESEKSSKLVFDGVQFFSNLEQGYSSFEGELPGKILFSDSQSLVHEKLGQPVETNKKFRLDSWFINGLDYAVEYAKGVPGIAMISVSIPLKKY
jgi:hypothetical protein